jgi:hypothetical protein
LRILFLLLTAAALWLAFSPGPDEKDPGAATGGGLVFAASFALLAAFPTWRGLQLGLGVFLLGTVFLPPAAGDKNPEAANAAAIILAAVFLAVAVWRFVAKLPFVAEFRRRIGGGIAALDERMPNRLRPLEKWFQRSRKRQWALGITAGLWLLSVVVGGVEDPAEAVFLLLSFPCFFAALWVVLALGDWTRRRVRGAQV